MGYIQKPETQRDHDLIKDYLEGKYDKETKTTVWEYSIAELGVKYARKENDKTIPITSTRIYQILEKNAVKTNRLAARAK